MSNLDLDAIEARCNFMPSGPWEVSRAGVSVKHPPSGHGVPAWCVCELAAAARTDIPLLVARVRELEAEVAELEAEVERVAEMYYDQKEGRKKFDAGLALIPQPCSDDETRVTLDGAPVLGVDGKGGLYYAWAIGEGETFGPGYCSPLTDWYPTREAAIRAGLRELAERETL